MFCLRLPNAKIAILFQNDDYGKDYLQGMKDGLGSLASKMIVAEESSEVVSQAVVGQMTGGQDRILRQALGPHHRRRRCCCR